MDDRELLEAAAKAAAGRCYRWFGEHFHVKTSHDPMLWESWNPLTDDGDALRLAVRLGLAISVEHSFGSTVVLWGPPTGNVREMHGTCPGAATRRAIVRAAAEIGKAMS